jgi:hypothetical protein
MPEVPSVRKVLMEMEPGTKDCVLELRSGESLTGDYLGFEDGIARLRTADGEEAIEAEEVIKVLIKLELPIDGPE